MALCFVMIHLFSGPHNIFMCWWFVLSRSAITTPDCKTFYWHLWASLVQVCYRNRNKCGGVCRAEILSRISWMNWNYRLIFVFFLSRLGIWILLKHWIFMYVIIIINMWKAWVASFVWSLHMARVYYQHFFKISCWKCMIKRIFRYNSATMWRTMVQHHLSTLRKAWAMLWNTSRNVSSSWCLYSSLLMNQWVKQMSKLKEIIILSLHLDFR